jgi:hypothetical protein
VHSWMILCWFMDDFMLALQVAIYSPIMFIKLKIITMEVLHVHPPQIGSIYA